MGKIYQIMVVGIKGEKKTVDVATSEEEFNKITILEFKKKVAEKLPGQAGKNKCYSRLISQIQRTFLKKFVKTVWHVTGGDFHIA